MSHYIDVYDLTLSRLTHGSKEQSGVPGPDSITLSPVAHLRSKYSCTLSMRSPFFPAVGICFALAQSFRTTTVSCAEETEKCQLHYPYGSGE